MKQKKTFYNVYGVTIRIDHTCLWEFGDILSYFRCGPISNPNIHLTIGSCPPPIGCRQIDRCTFVKENYIQQQEYSCKYSVKRGKFWDLRFVWNRAPLFFIKPNNFLAVSLYKYRYPQLMLIMPVLKEILSSRGFLMVHGAAVSDGKKSILMIGRGGAKKTTMTMEFLRKGYKYIGDDYILIKDNKIYPFPIFFTDFVYKMKNTEGEDLSLRDKFKFLITDMFELNSDPNFQMSDPLPFDDCFIASKVNEKDKILFNKIDISPEDLTRSANVNTSSEHFDVYMGFNVFLPGFFMPKARYQYAFPKSDMFSDSSQLIKPKNIYELHVSKKSDAIKAVGKIIGADYV